MQGKDEEKKSEIRGWLLMKVKRLNAGDRVLARGIGQ
jgi:hypothetical protein